jgi:hypothetical protein
VILASAVLELCDSGGESANSHPAFLAVQSARQSRAEAPEAWNDALGRVCHKRVLKLWVEQHALLSWYDFPEKPKLNCRKNLRGG